MDDLLKDKIVESILKNWTKKARELQSTERGELEAAVQAETTISHLSQITASYGKKIKDIEDLYQSAAGKVDEGVTDSLPDELITSCLEADRINAIAALDNAIATLEAWSEYKRGIPQRL